MNALEYIAATVEPSGLHNFEAAVLHALRSAGCTLGAQDKITHHWYKRLVDNIGLELEFLHTDDPKVPQVASIKVHLLGAAIAVDDIDVNDGPKAYKQPIRDAMRMLSMFCLAPEEFERSYKWLADRLTSRIAAQGDNMAAIRSRVAHAFHLNRVTATVEPGHDTWALFLALAKRCPRPHARAHIAKGGRIGPASCMFKGYKFEFKWTHDVNNDGSPVSDEPRAEITVDTKRGDVFTIGLRNRTVMLSNPLAQSSRFVVCPELHGLLADFTKIKYVLRGGTPELGMPPVIVADMRPVLTKWSDKILHVCGL